ncbi:MAG TPA: hypothetical protein VLI06_19835 [Solimonas sp.]|nr:hypothetical protein [Solimonas sp.]
MNNRFLERAGAWSALAYIIVFGGAWFNIAGFLPPISPTESAVAVAEQFRERNFPLMLASLLMMCSNWALLLFAALLTLIIRKIEGCVGMLTLMMGFTFATFLVLNFYMGLSFALAAFRPDRAPELIQFATDSAFLQVLGGIPMFVGVWSLAAYAILVVSPRENPIMPRWFGYLNLWAAISLLPELLVFFFKTGPFAWDGLLGFWIPAAATVGYCFVSPLVFVPVVRKHFP